MKLLYLSIAFHFIAHFQGLPEPKRMSNTLWVTKVPFFVKQRPCNRNFAFRFRARSVLHFFFAACAKLFYARGTVKKRKECCTYVKQEPESCSSVKNYPPVKMEMVFSDYAKRRILVLRRRGKYPPTTSKLPQSIEIRVSWRGI